MKLIQVDIPIPVGVLFFNALRQNSSQNSSQNH